MQVNPQQAPRIGRANEQQLRDRLTATMNEFFSNDDQLQRALNFRWEGDNMERIHVVTVEGNTEIGGKMSRVHGHYTVRILHTTNIGFANTHKPTSASGAPNPGYRPEGEPLTGNILASIWNNLPDFPPWEPPMQNMNVLLRRINDIRSQTEYNLKETDTVEGRLQKAIAFEEANGRRIVQEHRASKASQ